MFLQFRCQALWSRICTGVSCLIDLIEKLHVRHPIYPKSHTLSSPTLLHGFLSAFHSRFLRAIMTDNDDNMSPSLPAKPSLPWRFGSAATIGFVGSAARGFLYGLNYMEVTGLEGFLEKLDKRKDIDGRERGLITGKPFRGTDMDIWSKSLTLGSIKSCQRDGRSFDLGCSAI